MAITYLVPIILIAGFAFYYLNIYRKGKAAGGGFVAGVQAQQREKWQELLDPGEELRVWGSGVLWRPAWQYWLASQVPLLRLVWPAKMYQLIITDRGRFLMGTFGALGNLADKKKFEKGSVSLSDAVEEAQGWAFKLNPLVPKDYKTFDATIKLPDGALRLTTVPNDFVTALRTG